MRIHLTEKQWQRSEKKDVSQRIREKKSKRVKVRVRQLDLIEAIAEAGVNAKERAELTKRLNRKRGKKREPVHRMF